MEKNNKLYCLAWKSTTGKLLPCRYYVSKYEAYKRLHNLGKGNFIITTKL